ncbi:hypothetical protein Cni_G15522 [Canna indica]|uniref:DUF4283 domain-containing protein n=1 Tax=Canna indica TaxID=4628 RepID=A0AAQ3KH52_9LILI|nr:hypothetical protein Cni_G15522 [Canna indica]
MSGGKGDDAGDLRKKAPDPNLSGQIWIPKPKKPLDPRALPISVDGQSEGKGKSVIQAPGGGGRDAAKLVGDLTLAGKEGDRGKSSNIATDEREPNISKPNKPGSWAALFKKVGLSSDDLYSREAETKINAIQENSMDVVQIEEELMQVSRSQWINCLYGKFFGKTPPLSLIQNIMPKIWIIKHSLHVIDLASGYFCFKFTSNEDLNLVLSNGPWFLNGKVLLITPWKANFQPFLDKIETIPVWIQLPRLPIEYLYKDILLKLAAKIGHPVKCDEVTTKGLRAKFARIWVLWKLSDTVPSGIWVNCMGYRF